MEKYSYKEIDTVTVGKLPLQPPIFLGQKHMSIKVIRLILELPVKNSKLLSYPWHFSVAYFQNFADNKSSLGNFTKNTREGTFNPLKNERLLEIFCPRKKSHLDK